MRDTLGTVVWQLQSGTDISASDIVEGLVLVGYGKEGPKAGNLEAYDRTGACLWHDAPVLAADGSAAAPGSGIFWVKDMVVSDLDGNGSLELLVVAGDVHWSSNKILVYSPPSGKRIGEYSSQGDIGPVEVFDMDGDGAKETLIRAICNPLGRHILEDGRVIYAWTVLLFSGTNINGVSPFSGSAEEEMASTQLWCLLATPLERNDAGLGLVWDMGYSDPEVGFKKRLDDGTTAATVYLSEGFLYYLDARGQFRGGGRADRASEGERAPELYTIAATPEGWVLTGILTGAEEFVAR